eukprot:CAMPEP_0179307186 /NCGR_PEP_ID=MMETSP0797-20121207/50517_1 /TAXON_ID=47934 /ORGANISM="Dinophysis acuminata, Strain DAEP01" /LENGTH=257 /DNA_ID=CAMNT_0021016873 /DNA_START=71 /DNA_END=842 /DNA_ORIENTATION=-
MLQGDASSSEDDIKLHLSALVGAGARRDLGEPRLPLAEGTAPALAQDDLLRAPRGVDVQRLFEEHLCGAALGDLPAPDRRFRLRALAGRAPAAAEGPPGLPVPPAGAGGGSLLAAPADAGDGASALRPGGPRGTRDHRRRPAWEPHPVGPAGVPQGGEVRGVPAGAGLQPLRRAPLREGWGHDLGAVLEAHRALPGLRMELPMAGFAIVGHSLWFRTFIGFAMPEGSQDDVRESTRLLPNASVWRVTLGPPDEDEVR